MNPSNKFLICLYSDPNFLAVNILENLIANSCYVNVITSDVDGWRKRTSNIALKTRFSILSQNSIKSETKYSYSVCCIGFLNKDSAEKDLRYFIKNRNIKDSKTLLIFPQEVYGLIDSKKLDSFQNIGVVYLSDMIGPRMDFTSNTRIARYLSEAIKSQKFTTPIGETVSPIFVSDAAKQISKWLFSFGPYGKEIFLKGEEMSSQTFWLTLRSVFGDIQHISTQEKIKETIPRNIEKYQLRTDLFFILKETHKWVLTEKPNIQNATHTPKINLSKTLTPPSTKRKKYNFKPLALSIFTVLLFPLFLLIISSLLTFVSYKQLLKGHSSLTLRLLSITKITSSISYFESRALGYVPFIGRMYKETAYLSDVLIEVSDLGSYAVPLIDTAGTLLSNVLKNNPYSVESLLYDSEEKLRKIYDTTVSIEEKTGQAKNNNIFVSDKISSKINFGFYKNIILQITNMTERLPYILGEYQSKTYLILFQNNMELRPTGGFIGSFGLLTLDKGRLSEFNVSDVYSADGQLMGHVEPPSPIRDYLGEANWWLRDSNWDPDYPISAKRAEWFLDKEIDKQVDGVIAIDLSPIRDFLTLSGSINLSDYGLVINDSNLYEEVQSEVQDEAFPGTHKKASFLTALSRSILDKIGEISYEQKISTLKLIYKNFEERHMQAYIHDAAFQESLSQLNWEGSVFVPYCGENCYSDLVGIVEANVGVNKSNYFVKRGLETKININGQRIERTLNLTIQNSANTSLGRSGLYKSYIRLMVPEDSGSITVKSEYGQNTRILTPDIVNAKGRKEIGVILETQPGETKKIEFSWVSIVEKQPKAYNLYIRKQAGVDEMPVSINIHTPLEVIGTSPGFTLTEGGDYLYNTTLTRDLSARLSL